MSGISIGTNIRAALLDSEAVTAITSDAYPVARDTARLPYIVYTLTGLDESKYKEGHYDIVTVDLDCYGVDYDSAIALAGPPATPSRVQAITACGAATYPTCAPGRPATRIM